MTFIFFLFGVFHLILFYRICIYSQPARLSAHPKCFFSPFHSASSPPALLQCLPLILVSETCHHIMFLPFQLEYMDFLPAQPALRKHCIMQGTPAQHNRESALIYSPSYIPSMQHLAEIAPMWRPKV